MQRLVLQSTICSEACYTGSAHCAIPVYLLIVCMSGVLLLSSIEAYDVSFESRLLYIIVSSLAACFS